eukprot:2547960-Rhodomonas_salina.2
MRSQPRDDHAIAPGLGRAVSTLAVTVSSGPRAGPGSNDEHSESDSVRAAPMPFNLCVWANFGQQPTTQVTRRPQWSTKTRRAVDSCENGTKMMTMTEVESKSPT